ncbi:MAG: 2-oxo acid dehydrogenase subunit E2 [Solirubrobacteraceae bacterium]
MGPKGKVRVVEPSRTEEAHARRVASAKATVPELVLRSSIPGSVSLGQLVHACARALREHPRLNASYRDGRFELHGRVNVAASEDGLLAPTIFDADTKSAAEISRELDELRARGRAGELAPTDVSGATFTVATLAVPGFTAVLHPPQAAVLAVGVGGEGPTQIALTCDHRILFGPEAAAFLALVAELLRSEAT